MGLRDLLLKDFEINFAHASTCEKVLPLTFLTHFKLVLFLYLPPGGGYNQCIIYIEFFWLNTYILGL